MQARQDKERKAEMASAKTEVRRRMPPWRWSGLRDTGTPPFPNGYRVGTASRFRRLEVPMPPRITMASGNSISCPGVRPAATGVTKVSPIANVVIGIGASRSHAARAIWRHPRSITRAFGRSNDSRARSMLSPSGRHPHGCCSQCQGRRDAACKNSKFLLAPNPLAAKTCGEPIIVGARGRRFDKGSSFRGQGGAMKLVRHSLLFLLIAAMAIPLQAAAEGDNSPG
jgi:hypothetical protein